jgi:hypothetical protein
MIKNYINKTVGKEGKRGLTDPINPTSPIASQNNIFSKLVIIAIWSVIATALTIMLLIIFWSFYPYKIVEFKDDVFPVITKEVKPGGQLLYRSRACKTMDFDSTVTRAFQDEIVFPLAEQTSHRLVGCSDQTIAINVPLTLVPDTYVLKTNFTYKPNPIRTITITKYTESFVVISN